MNASHLKCITSNHFLVVFSTKLVPHKFTLSMYVYECVCTINQHQCNKSLHYLTSIFSSFTRGDNSCKHILVSLSTSWTLQNKKERSKLKFYFSLNTTLYLILWWNKIRDRVQKCNITSEFPEMFFQRILPEIEIHDGALHCCIFYWTIFIV